MIISLWFTFALEGCSLLLKISHTDANNATVKYYQNYPVKIQPICKLKYIYTLRDLKIYR